MTAMENFDPVIAEHYPGFRVTLRIGDIINCIELKVVDIRNPDPMTHWNRRFVWSHEQLDIHRLQTGDPKEWNKVFDVADRLVKELKAEPVKVRRSEVLRIKVDPLDVQYDGITLRRLIPMDDERRQCDSSRWPHSFTPAQRAAVSAHWSAELRAKVEATKVKERNMVTYCEEDDL